MTHAIRGVLYISAHPDDETIMAGGTLAMLHERGTPTHIICAAAGAWIPDHTDADQPNPTE